MLIFAILRIGRLEVNLTVYNFTMKRRDVPFPLDDYGVEAKGIYNVSDIHVYTSV